MFVIKLEFNSFNWAPVTFNCYAVFCCVGSTGSATTGNASTVRGVSPMFCFGNKVGGSSGGGGTTPAPKEYAVTLSGSLNSNEAYVTINGTKYSSAQTVSVVQGTVAEVYVAGRNYSNTRMYLNGAEVLSGKGTYSLTVNSNCTINYMLKGMGDAYNCNITTE